MASKTAGHQRKSVAENETRLSVRSLGPAFATMERWMIDGRMSMPEIIWSLISYQIFSTCLRWAYWCMQPNFSLRRRDVLFLSLSLSCPRSHSLSLMNSRLCMYSWWCIQNGLIGWRCRKSSTYTHAHNFVFGVHLHSCKRWSLTGEHNKWRFAHVPVFRCF